MKKKNLKNLALNKKSISKLQSSSHIVGGTDWPDTAKFCPDPNGSNGCSEPCNPINIPTIDIPTINDSCFSWCDDKCNDW
jgi:hypothetical protein